MNQLLASPEGISTEEASKRLLLHGSNLLRPRRRTDAISLLAVQFKSPIIIILLIAASISFFLADKPDAVIILVIVFASALLGFWQERGAANAVSKLLAMVQIDVSVLRDGTVHSIPIEDIVPGDIVMLSAGDNVPGDCLILRSKDLFVDEASLTGETYPVEKMEGKLPPDTPLAMRTNALFMGTHVVSGTASAVVVLTGKKTEFGKVSERLRLRPQDTEFERGVKRFGYFLMEVTLILVIAIFGINVYLNRPVLDSFMFSLALAVGLTPQLLPAIISINLAHGARTMAESKVIVKRLQSIENFGSMNVLCSDKTGTLTQGTIEILSILDAEGAENAEVGLYAYLNSQFQTGFSNPIDEAVRKRTGYDISGYLKLDEVPYDFVRKRLSVLLKTKDTTIMITKGSFQNIMSVCSTAKVPSSGEVVDISSVGMGIQKTFNDLSSKGSRILGVAFRMMGSQSVISKDSEKDMTFVGFLVMHDPPKSDLKKVVCNLRDIGVRLKVISGDNKTVTRMIVQQVGIEDPVVLTGSELRNMSDEALVERVGSVDVFAEVEPNQKERIILALRKRGNVVGYMGDGINDASALHAADVGISVDSAVDVAKEAADIVLLEKDLGVLQEGVKAGRRTFANTLKYVFMATSANFGNMFSMAGASLFLAFLPLLPKQVLLTNLLTDFPETAIATDSVDPEMVEKPRRWDIKFIRRFMMVFGFVSSVFDFATFGILILLLNATQDQFRTGWFLESVVSAAAIVLVVRTRRPFFKSRPGKGLFRATMVIFAVALALPYLMPYSVFDFRPLPISFLLIMAGIVVLYVFSAELTKHFFYQKASQGS
jgi:Mg2+-importing ATPase